MKEQVAAIVNDNKKYLYISLGSLLFLGIIFPNFFAQAALLLIVGIVVVYVLYKTSGYALKIAFTFVLGFLKLMSMIVAVGIIFMVLSYF